jgi:hypothetical protein
MANQKPSDTDLLTTFYSALNWTVQPETNGITEVRTADGTRLTINKPCRIKLLSFLSQAFQDHGPDLRDVADFIWITGQACSRFLGQQVGRQHVWELINVGEMVLVHTRGLVDTAVKEHDRLKLALGKEYKLFYAVLPSVKNRLVRLKLIKQYIRKKLLEADPICICDLSPLVEVSMDEMLTTFNGIQKDVMRCYDAKLFRDDLVAAYHYYKHRVIMGKTLSSKQYFKLVRTLVRKMEMTNIGVWTEVDKETEEDAFLLQTLGEHTRWYHWIEVTPVTPVTDASRAEQSLVSHLYRYECDGCHEVLIGYHYDVWGSTVTLGDPRVRVRTCFQRR